MTNSTSNNDRSLGALRALSSFFCFSGFLCGVEGFVFGISGVGRIVTAKRV